MKPQFVGCNAALNLTHTPADHGGVWARRDDGSMLVLCRILNPEVVLSLFGRRPKSDYSNSLTNITIRCDMVMYSNALWRGLPHRDITFGCKLLEYFTPCRIDGSTVPGNPSGLTILRIPLVQIWDYSPTNKGRFLMGRGGSYNY